MKSIITWGIVGVMTLGVSAALTAQQAKKPAKTPAATEQSEKGEAKKPAAKVQLPAAIQDAFRKTYPGATIKNVSKETENGKTVYEVESVDQGMNRDLNYNPDGTVIDIEEQVKITDLPTAVTEAVKKMYPKASITKAEKLTRGQTMQYELTLKGAPKASVELTPDGKPVPPEKPEKK